MDGMFRNGMSEVRCSAARAEGAEKVRRIRGPVLFVFPWLLCRLTCWAFWKPIYPHLKAVGGIPTGSLLSYCIVFRSLFFSILYLLSLVLVLYCSTTRRGWTGIGLYHRPSLGCHFVPNVLNSHEVVDWGHRYRPARMSSERYESIVCAPSLISDLGMA